MKFIEVTEIKKNEEAGVESHKKYVINTNHILFFTIAKAGVIEIKLTDGSIVNASISFNKLKKELKISDAK